MSDYVKQGKLSVIVPYVQEWPQIAFTLRSLAEEMRGMDFEIIAVDNFAEEVMVSQGVEEPDRGHKQLPVVMRGNPWLKAIQYRDKLSHWNAKNKGVQHGEGEFLLFCDSHCVPGRGSISHAFQYYKENWEVLNGTLHLPLTYHILEYKKLIYKLVADKSIGRLRYSFSAYRDENFPYEVSCMSTCGMFMHRSIYDELGGWPKSLGIYGGGENFINFTLAILGKKKYIMPGEPLYHHGDKRGYHWYYDDMSKNRAIANYMVGGKEWLDLYIGNRKGDPEILMDIQDDVVAECGAQRQMIKNKQVMSIEDWIAHWQGS